MQGPHPHQWVPAGASSTSVGPLQGKWLAARIADLTTDLLVLFSWGSTVVSFHSQLFSINYYTQHYFIEAKVIKLFMHNSTEYEISTTCCKKILFLLWKPSKSNDEFIMLINVKKPKLVGMLTFMSRINLKLSSAGFFITLRTGLVLKSTLSGLNYPI